MTRPILGKSYRDKITGFKGVATGYVEYISGCNQVLLTAKATDDGKVNTLWLDVQRMEGIKGERIVLDNKEIQGHDVVAPVR